jgi:phage terminase large subunit-like protein
MATSLCSRLSEVALEKLEQLDEEEIIALTDAALQERYARIDALCGQDKASFDCGPLLWLTRHTKTENPQYEQQGLPFLAGFPRKSYFVPLFEAFLARPRQLFVPKSRTMMTSWAAAGLATWLAQWKREETVIQTMNEDKALHLIDYARQLVRYQDSQLSRLHPVKKQSAFSIAWEDGGTVDAVPGGADAIRSFHPSLFIMDEAAHIPEGEESLNAVLPSQARVIAISTAKSGWFENICSDPGEHKESPVERIVKAKLSQPPYPYPIDRQNC